MTTSSGNRSVDDSARRAILIQAGIAAAVDYSGSIVTVEFWFEFEGKNVLQEARVKWARLPGRALLL